MLRLKRPLLIEQRVACRAGTVRDPGQEARGRDATGSRPRRSGNHRRKYLHAPLQRHPDRPV